MNLTEVERWMSKERADQRDPWLPVKQKQSVVRMPTLYDIKSLKMEQQVPGIKPLPAPASEPHVKVQAGERATESEAETGKQQGRDGDAEQIQGCIHRGNYRRLCERGDDCSPTALQTPVLLYDETFMSGPKGYVRV